MYDKISFGPSRVCALPVALASERVHYFCDYVFFFFSATYFSPRRLFATVLKFCMEFLATKNKIWGLPPLLPMRDMYDEFFFASADGG